MPGDVPGRVVAVWRTVVRGATSAGAPIGGLASTAQGVNAPFPLSAVLGVVVLPTAPRPSTATAA
ncbi:hypothetical protein LX16_1625 [Stackebrandtia albiflava]|uniref:Uncharacterized protein n=1 Tax=Stackebrandtia albiflava TaxID=406432 RepID=A0A562VDE2_9ACTN|nr:hypothetical protein LX16_1625 [Stackebrandtia albiflava]